MYGAAYKVTKNKNIKSTDISKFLPETFNINKNFNSFFCTYVNLSANNVSSKNSNVLKKK